MIVVVLRIISSMLLIHVMINGSIMTCSKRLLMGMVVVCRMSLCNWMSVWVLLMVQVMMMVLLLGM